jgi:hydrogenase maturation protease
MINPAAVIIYGIGNQYRSDDAIGLIIARQLKAKNLAGVQVKEVQNDSLLSMAAWNKRQKVILIDAASSGSKPGSVFRFDLKKQKIPAGKFRFSTHHISVQDAVRLAYELHYFPEELRLFAIEGKSFDSGTTISTELITASETVQSEVINLCKQWMKQHSPAE